MLVSSAAMTVGAQSSEIPSQKFTVATASFWSNWFVQADVAFTSFYGDKGNTPATSLPSALTKDFRTNCDISLALGKWFTPGMGLRTKWKGVWGRSVVSDDKEHNAMKCWTLSEQLLFNLSNMFGGYNEERLWSLVPYLSGSLGRNMSSNTYAMGLGFGLLNQWRLSDKILFNLDLAYDFFEPDFDGAGGRFFSKGVGGKDRILSAEIGITYSLGSSAFNHVPDVEAIKILSQSQIDALNAQLADEQAENERLRQKISESASQQP